MEPPCLGGRGGRRGSAMAPLERAMVVSYRLSIVTVALSVTIRPQFEIEYLRHSNQQGWVTLGPNLGVFPLEQTRHVGVAKSEHLRLTNGEINFEEFQPMWSQSTSVTDRRTDGRTDRHADRQTTCDRNTALCTKVHRAVKILPKYTLTSKRPSGGGSTIGGRRRTDGSST